MKIYIIVLVFLTLQIHAFCQKLELRPSIGWGHGFGHNYEIKTNDNNTPYTVIFDKPFKPSIELPQLGFMIDFNYKNKWIISLGRMHGKTELKSTINGATHSAALIQKWGGEFLYSTYNYKNKFRSFVICGIYYANNSNFDYNASKTEFATIDATGKTITRSYDTSINVRKHGTTLNAGVRFAFYNVKKSRERLSLTLNYDFGLNNLWTYKNIFEYEYTTKYVHAYSTSKGNQIKIYISKPINLYDFKKTN
jgi:hypothetical protein